MAHQGDAGIETLLAERSIERVILRYCRGVDRMDRELVRSCYHAGATDSHGSFTGTVDEYLVWVWRVLARYSVTMHFLGNVLIELDPATRTGPGPRPTASPSTAPTMGRRPAT